MIMPDYHHSFLVDVVCLISNWQVLRREQSLEHLSRFRQHNRLWDFLAKHLCLTEKGCSHRIDVSLSLVTSCLWETSVITFLWTNVRHTQLTIGLPWLWRWWGVISYLLCIKIAISVVDMAFWSEFHFLSFSYNIFLCFLPWDVTVL